jgi:hypothetical protein
MLQRAVDDFLLQDYPGESELVIFNTHPLQQIEFNHPLVKVVNWRPRPKTLGACRNLCVEHCSNKVIIPWDDDDSYRKDHISSMIRDLGDSEAVKANGFWSDTCNGPKTFRKRGPVHQMAFSKRLFRKVGGYPEIDTEEDRGLYARFLKRVAVPEVMRDAQTSTLTYNNCGGQQHVSWNCSYQEHGKQNPKFRGVLNLNKAFKTGIDPRVNIISNVTNGAGLQRHAGILKRAFEDNGFRAALVQFNDPSTWVEADLNLSVEVINSDALRLAPINWFMPMPEWYFPDLWNHTIHRMSKVLCNTRHGVEMMSGVCSPVFTGFESLDLGSGGVPKQRRFLHVAGRSVNKNTEKVLETWARHKIRHPLTVVCACADVAPDKTPPNVRVLRRVDDVVLKHLIRSHWFHICVSKYEGWGHYIHEAISAGGLTILHDRPPLDEFPAFARTRAVRDGSLRMAPLFSPDVDSLAEVVEQCMSTSDEELVTASADLRAASLAAAADFRRRFAQLCAEVIGD